jgi:hypothetical protein
VLLFMMAEGVGERSIEEVKGWSEQNVTNCRRRERGDLVEAIFRVEDERRLM